MVAFKIIRNLIRFKKLNISLEIQSGDELEIFSNIKKKMM